MNSLQKSTRKSADDVKDIEDIRGGKDFENTEKANSGNDEIDVNLIEFEDFEKEIKINNEVELVMVNELKEKDEVEINHLHNNFRKITPQSQLIMKN